MIATYICILRVSPKGFYSKMLLSNWVWTLIPDFVLLNRVQSYNDRHKSIAVESKA